MWELLLLKLFCKLGGEWSRRGVRTHETEKGAVHRDYVLEKVKRGSDSSDRSLNSSSVLTGRKAKKKKKKIQANASSKQELTQNRTLQGHRRQYSDCLLVPWPGSLPLFSTSLRWWRRFFTQSRQGFAFYTQNPSHTIQSADMYW